MEINELILIAFGGLLSLIAFFLKKENARIDRVCEKLREQEVSLARNGARDSERREQTQRLLEDRRNDIIKLFERIDR